MEARTQEEELFNEMPYTKEKKSREIKKKKKNTPPLPLSFNVTYGGPGRLQRSYLTALITLSTCV